MNRRNFFAVAPLGIMGIAGLTKGQDPTPDKNDVVAAEGLVIVKDGKVYNLLAVPQESTQFAKLTKKEHINLRFNV